MLGYEWLSRTLIQCLINKAIHFDHQAKWRSYGHFKIIRRFSGENWEEIETETGKKYRDFKKWMITCIYVMSYNTVRQSGQNWVKFYKTIMKRVVNLRGRCELYKTLRSVEY